MGGVPALLLAELLDNVESVTLVEGNLVSTDCGILSRQSAAVSLKELQEEVMPGLKTALGEAESSGAKLWIDQIDTADIAAFQKSAKSLVTWSDTGNLPQKFRDLPVRKKYYIFGEESEQWQASEQQLREIFAGTDIHMEAIASASHFVMNDNPEDFYSTMASNLIAS